MQQKYWENDQVSQILKYAFLDIRKIPGIMTENKVSKIFKTTISFPLTEI